MRLDSLIDDIILDEQIQGNIDMDVWNALQQIRELAFHNNITFRKEHVG